MRGFGAGVFARHLFLCLVVEGQHPAFRLVGLQRHGFFQIVVEHQGGKPLGQCSVAGRFGRVFELVLDLTSLLEQLSDAACLPQLESACEMLDVVVIGGLGCWLLEQQWGHDGCCFERDALHRGPLAVRCVHLCFGLGKVFAR